MTDILKNESVLCIIKSHKNVGNSKVVANTIGNTIVNLLGGVGGRITNDFKLTLTTENLYIDAKSHSTWGGLPETVYEDKISIADIKTFEVKTEGKKEIIFLTTKNDKTTSFIRDNEKEDNLAFEMAKLIAITKNA
ncbi:hypothetical protein SAMN02745163_01583 [Clostridium cavendishii DSM 21758]|uniref:PH domain-containing protein n=1 Tax=Clostridium cavendishii DSM 21758 TaxID=1121302 RepID=A0A1M6HUE6_9CLOT|nr:hypothetical protein [Clostridium cavendishii]SHJ25780.1 hypothetical protein SAMN02745163_01583 [Clostridium cavendishii DSM 21758]